MSFSLLDLWAMDALTRIYVLNFRMLSAVYLVVVTLAALGRNQDVRERQRLRRMAKGEMSRSTSTRHGETAEKRQKTGLPPRPVLA